MRRCGRKCRHAAGRRGRLGSNDFCRINMADNYDPPDAIGMLSQLSYSLGIAKNRITAQIMTGTDSARVLSGCGGLGARHARCVGYCGQHHRVAGAE